MTPFMPRLVALAFSVLSLGAAAAQPLLQVDDAWARASVPGQQSSGAFMRLTAREPLSLVGASSPVAGLVEVHEMKMDGDVMRMRAVPALALPAGKPLELRPGGLHLMLMELKAPLQQGASIPVTLLLRNAQGGQERVEITMPVSARAPGPAGGDRAGTHGPSHRH